MAKFFKIPFAATGDILAVPDATQPDGSVSYSQGFGPDYQRKTDGSDPLAKTVPRNSTNALFNDLTGAVGEIQLNGVPAWQSVGAPYPINAIVRYNNKNWISQVANNSVTPVEGASWSEQPANSYTKVQVDTKLSTKANTATTLLGYGITDAYTKAQIDTALSGKANTATTLGGYGITDAYTKTEGDARYLRATNNLSDLPNKATARTNLELGTAAIATLTTSTTDATAARVTKNGDWGMGSTAQAPGFLDFKTDIPTGIYRGVFSSVANGPISSVLGFTAIPMRYSPISIVWLVTSFGRSWFGDYNITTGTITWNENYSSGNVSAFSQTLLSLTNAADGRTKLGVVDGVGINQTPQDVTASRAVNTTYTNSTGKPILVAVTCAMAPNVQGYLTVGGVDVVNLFFSSSTSITSIATYIIPVGATYRLNATSMTKWTELR